MERIYTIPLRKEWVKKSRRHRSPRAIREIRKFTLKHTKAEKISLSKGVNQTVWKSGKKSPPGKIKVKIIFEEGKASVQLPEEIIFKKEEKKGRLEKMTEKLKKEKEVEDEKVQTGAAVKTEPAKKTG